MWNEKYGNDWKQQKDRLFERKEFDSIPQLLAELLNLKNNGFFFRGQSDARYRVTSSIQRAWHKGEAWRKQRADLLFPDFSKDLVDFARNTLLAKFSRHHLMDHEIWAYLQHQCCPTPLIDFSIDPFTALHFATNHASTSDGYCSVYAMYPEEYAENGSGMNDIFFLEDFLETARRKENEGLQAIGVNDRIRNIRFVQEAQFKYWGYLDKRDYDDGLDCVPHTPKNGVAFLVVKDFKKWCKKLVCERMKLQKGLFVYSPIEEESLESFISRKQQKVNAKGETNDLVYPPMKCFDIPANLVEEARRVVKGEGISDTTLGLDPNPDERAVKAMYGEYLNRLVSSAKHP